MFKVLDFIEDYVAGGLLIFTSLLIFVQVVLRYIFSYSLIWSEELARYLIVWFVFFGSSLAVKEGSHASVDVVVKMLPEKFHKASTILIILISIVFTLALATAGLSMVLKVKNIGNITPALAIPMYIPYLAIPIGAIMMSIRFLQQLFYVIRPKSS